tara:strand:- start:3271 stop:4743 length:1473 start_codon:yes stop_codon:yes gene_type:complete
MRLFENIAKRFGYHKVQARSYSGAVQSRLTNDWLAPVTSGDEEIRRDLKKLRSRCRELERNNDYVRRYLNGVEANVLGASGIGLQMKVADTPGRPDVFANRAIEAAWKKWGKRKFTTPTGRQSWIDICRLALRSTIRDGDVMIKMNRGYKNDFGFNLQLIEADRLDVDYNVGKVKGGGSIRMGVEVDQFFRPVAYHVLSSHPGENSLAPVRRDRIPANQIIHLYSQERVSQTRGVPWMVSAMSRLQMLGGYEESELVASRVAASKMGFFVKESASEGYTGEQDTDYNLLMEAEPGSIEELPMGMKFQEWSPQHPTTAYKDFVKSCLRGIAAGLNVSYNMLANDLEGVNYSSIRAGLFDEREHYKSIQTWFIESFVEPIFEAWLESALLANVFPFGVGRFEKMNAPQWKPRRWPWVDPLKDQQASILAVENGLDSRRNIIAQTGGDIEDVFDSIAADKILAESKGLKFGEKNNSTEQVETESEEETMPANE